MERDFATGVEPHPVNRHAADARRDAERLYLDRLVDAYSIALSRISREARRNFRAATRKPQVISAAGEPAGWMMPDIDQVLSNDAAVEHLSSAEINRIREEVVRTVAGQVAGKAGLTLDYRNPMMRGVIEKLGTQISNISETTRADIMGEIRKAYDEGIGVTATAERIGGVYSMSRSRAEMIARTEFTSAQTSATLAGGVAIGMGYKTWLVSPGAPHPRHEEYDGLDGQTVPIDDYFDVGGYQADHPGDPDLPASEAIQCRCDVLMGDEVDGADTGHEGAFQIGMYQPPSLPVDIPEPVASLSMPTTRFESGTKEAYAQRLVADALKAEKPVTEDLVRLASAHNGQMLQLDQRVKTFDSLNRKLADKAAAKHVTVAEYSKKVDDVLRYTMQLDGADYTPALKDSIADLEANGYKVYSFENYWQRGDDYNGLHLGVTTPNGQKFELQFHTPESLAAKMKTHEPQLFEAYRTTVDPVRKLDLFNQMVEIADRVPMPPGVDELDHFVNHPVPKLGFSPMRPGPALLRSERYGVFDTPEPTAEMERLAAAERDLNWDVLGGEHGLETSQVSAAYKDWSQTRFVTRLMGSERYEALKAMEDATQMTYREFIGQWALSSTQEYGAQRLQAAAAQRWGLELRGYLAPLRELTDKALSKIGEMLSDQYQMTQEWFAERNIQSVTLYRGFAGSYKTWGDGGAVKWDGNPLSSWSSDAQTAIRFATHGGGDTAYVASISVPVDRIQSFYGTGFGCAGENEYVLLGNPPTTPDQARITIIGDPYDLGGAP